MLHRMGSTGRGESLSEQFLLKDVDLPIPQLDRLESIQINQQLLRDSSDFVAFRNDDVMGASRIDGPASLLRQSSLDAISRDEQNIGGTAADISAWLEMQPELEPKREAGKVQKGNEASVAGVGAEDEGEQL